MAGFEPQTNLMKVEKNANLAPFLIFLNKITSFTYVNDFTKGRCEKIYIKMAPFTHQFFTRVILLCI